MKHLLASALLATGCLGSTGCAALIEAGFRELDDHGDDPRYEHQSFGSHFLDSLGEDDDDDDCHDTYPTDRYYTEGYNTDRYHTHHTHTVVVARH